MPNYPNLSNLNKIRSISKENDISNNNNDFGVLKYEPNEKNLTFMNFLKGTFAGIESIFKKDSKEYNYSLKSNSPYNILFKVNIDNFPELKKNMMEFLRPIYKRQKKNLKSLFKNKIEIKSQVNKIFEKNNKNNQLKMIGEIEKEFYYNFLQKEIRKNQPKYISNKISIKYMNNQNDNYNNCYNNDFYESYSNEEIKGNKNVNNEVSNNVNNEVSNNSDYLNQNIISCNSNTNTYDSKNIVSESVKINDSNNINPIDNINLDTKSIDPKQTNSFKVPVFETTVSFPERKTSNPIIANSLRNSINNFSSFPIPLNEYKDKNDSLQDNKESISYRKLSDFNHTSSQEGFKPYFSNNYKLDLKKYLNTNIVNKGKKSICINNNSNSNIINGFKFCSPVKIRDTKNSKTCERENSKLKNLFIGIKNLKNGNNSSLINDHKDSSPIKKNNINLQDKMNINNILKDKYSSAINVKIRKERIGSANFLVFNNKKDINEKNAKKKPFIEEEDVDYNYLNDFSGGTDIKNIGVRTPIRNCILDWKKTVNNNFEQQANLPKKDFNINNYWKNSNELLKENTNIQNSQIEKNKSLNLFRTSFFNLPLISQLKQNK